MLQLHLTGGEPAARPDLPDLVRHAARAGLYTNLITSGVTLTETLFGSLIASGLDHVQLSFQDADPTQADRLGGTRESQRRKLRAAALVTEAGVPLTANFVVHRQNLERLPAMIALGERIGATRIEIAHVQYHGWALRNRDALLPTLSQLEIATEIVAAARDALHGRVTIDYVVPDYHAARPKACMGGWARQALIITPAGVVLPCHAAESLTGLHFPSVRTTSLAAIWSNDPAFTRFRGTGWMPEPCRSCNRREIDWGGCRCQAMALLGDPALTDPACSLSPHHHVMEDAVERSGSPAFAYRV